MEINVTKPTQALLQKLADSGFALNKADGKWFIERVEQIKTDEGYSSDIKPAIAADKTAAQAIVDGFIEPMPDLSKRQFNRFLAHTGLDDAIAARLAVLKLISRAQYADLKVWFNDPVCPIKYDTVYNKIQAIKNDLPVQVPPLVLSANALKSAWNSAATLTGGD